MNTNTQNRKASNTLTRKVRDGKKFLCFVVAETLTEEPETAAQTSVESCKRIKGARMDAGNKRPDHPLRDGSLGALPMANGKGGWLWGFQSFSQQLKTEAAMWEKLLLFHFISFCRTLNLCWVNYIHITETRASSQ